MTKMLIDRSTVEQALEALTVAWQQNPRWQITEGMHALRAALEQQAEPFTPDAIRTTQTAWKMGYDAAKAETQPAEPQTTHSAECWRWHHGCAIAEVERLRAALAQQAYTDDLNQRIKLYVGSRCAPPQQAEPVAFDWPRKACPCRDVQNGECLKLGCKWERDPSLVPQSLRRASRPIDEGELWSWVRSVMSQGADIRFDYEQGVHKGYEAYSARLDAAAAERAEELAARLKTPNVK